MRVFVVNGDGQPLTPCHPARARRLLRERRARLLQHHPFTIELTYTVERPVVRPVKVGIDDGGKVAGFAVVLDGAEHQPDRVGVWGEAAGCRRASRPKRTASCAA